MIKLPEPFLVRHEDVCGGEVGPPTPCYTEAQLKQAVRDAYEDAVQVCRKTCSAEDSMFGDGYNTGAYQCERNLRALIKEIE